jgi:hypothetical protein
MNSKRVTIKDLFPSKYLKAVDLPDVGVIVAITGWQIEEFENNG